jgi:hypothetical protein
MTVNKVKTLAELIGVIKNAIEGVATVVEHSEEREGYISIKTDDIAEIAYMINEIKKDVEKEIEWFPNNSHLRKLNEKIMLVQVMGNKAIGK